MSTIGYAFTIAGITCCCLLSLLLWCFSNKDEVQQKLLSIIFLTIGWYAFMYLLVSKGWITWCPFLFRLGMPFYYLVPPFALFYTQLLLKERNTIFLKTFLFHSLPFLLGFIDLIGYYINNYRKLHYIAEQVLLDPVNSYIIGSGFIPAWAHYLFRPIHGCFYLILIGISLFKALKSIHIKNANKQSLTWLFILNGFLALNYTSTFYTSFIKPTNSFPILETSIIFAFAIVVCFFVMSIKPFFSPYIIYRDKEGIDVMPAKQPTPSYEEINLKRKQSIHDDHKASIKKGTLLSEERILEIASAMDHAISEQQQFKKLNRIGDLADYLNLSPYYLSYVLSKHYELNFNDYINYFRINHIIQLMESAQYKDFTLEGIAKEAGFSSRAAFSIAFKKQTGLSPTQYLDQYRL